MHSSLDVDNEDPEILRRYCQVQRSLGDDDDEQRPLDDAARCREALMIATKTLRSSDDTRLLKFLRMVMTDQWS